MLEILHLAIQLGPEPSRTSIDRSPGFLLAEVKVGFGDGLLLTLVDARTDFRDIQWYRERSSSVYSPEGACSRRRAAIARAQGPAPMIITS